MYPYDSEITTRDAAKLLGRTHVVIRKWVSRYNVPSLGRTRQREALWDYRILAEVDRAIRQARPVPTDWTEFVRHLVA